MFSQFSVTRLSVNYSRWSTKHIDLYSIFTTTLPKDKTTICCNKA